MLNFVRYELQRSSDGANPIVIDFNPWWFTDRDHLASQFLEQFRSKLPRESKALLEVGNAMAEYSGYLSKLVAVSTGHLWIDVPMGWLLKLLRTKPKDVAKLKSEISKKLAEAGQRFVFIIDDLDRLTPDEIREVFKVTKALADFPNVVYVLSFDREVVVESLRRSLGVDGDIYLEKIVQAPFSLPSVDKLLLRQKLFSDLNTLLESRQDSKIDSGYWGNVYFDGLESYVVKPRDVVRIVNALSVTYPAVAGEVNTVDYIAIEFLRLFEPTLYATIRDNREMFVGTPDRGERGNGGPIRVFHEHWLEQLPAERRPAAKALVSRLFPRANAVWGGMHYGGEWNLTWRSELRICSSEMFDIYFQFGVPPSVLSQSEFDSFLGAAEDGDVAIAALRRASGVIRPDGHSKARDIVDRLREVGEKLPERTARKLLSAILELGDELLVPQDARGGFMGIPNQWRILFLVNVLLKPIQAADHRGLISGAIAGASDVGIAVAIVSYVERAHQKEERDQPLSQLDDEALLAMKEAVVTRLAALEPASLAKRDDFVPILLSWRDWESSAVIRSRFAAYVEDSNNLPDLLEKFLSVGMRQSVGDRVSRETYSLNPNSIAAIADLGELEPRVVELLKHADRLSERQRIACSRFLKGMERLHQGKDPAGIYFEDYD